MAENENGAAPPQTDGAMARSVMINAQYVKDLSFENPRAPQSLIRTPDQQPPEVSVGIDVKVQNLAPNMFEVALTVHAEAKSGNDRVFLVELVYGGVVTLQNVGEVDVPRALLIETPSLLFPFARSIIASATQDGGFMPLLIQPIDFAELVRRQQQSAQGQAAALA